MNTQTENKTKLEQKYAFWYRISEEALLGTKQQSQNEYENQVKKISEFDTVEDFWAIFQHLRKPDSCKPGIEFQMFKDGVKPMWEDKANKTGGKLSVKLKKDYTTIIWEEVILALIGGVLPDVAKNEINGVVVSIRKEFNILQVWFKNYSQSVINELEQILKDLLQVPEGVEIEAKQFFRSSGFHKQKENAGFHPPHKRKI